MFLRHSEGCISEVSFTGCPSLRQEEILASAIHLIVPDSSEQNDLIDEAESIGTALIRYFDAGIPSHPVREKWYPLDSSRKK